MQNSQIYIKQKFTPIRTYKIASKSKKGIIRTVEIYGDGNLSCDCPAGQMNKECRHKKMVGKSPNLKVEYFPQGCWYCKTPAENRGLSEHHLYRGADRKTSPSIYLCFLCHRKATDDIGFEKHLQELYENTILRQR